jgi:hypothetical protein
VNAKYSISCPSKKDCRGQQIAVNEVVEGLRARNLRAGNGFIYYGASDLVISDTVSKGKE